MTINWEMDPITRSLLDTDFYQAADAPVHLEELSLGRAPHSPLINRTTSVQLGEIVSVGPTARTTRSHTCLGFRKSELVWLAGNTFLRPAAGFSTRHFSIGSSTEFELSEFELPSTMDSFSFNSKASVPGTLRCGRSTLSLKSAS